MENPATPENAPENHPPRRKDLQPIQEKAIVCLINEPTIRRAAQAAGIGERTLHRWMQQRDFLASYRAARRAAFTQAISVTQHYAAAAVHTLAQIMADRAAPPAARVAAATAVLKFSRDSIEIDDIAQRVEALERSQRGEPEPEPVDADWRESDGTTESTETSP